MSAAVDFAIKLSFQLKFYSAIELIEYFRVGCNGINFLEDSQRTQFRFIQSFFFLCFLCIFFYLIFTKQFDFLKEIESTSLGGHQSLHLRVDFILFVPFLHDLRRLDCMRALTWETSPHSGSFFSQPFYARNEARTQHLCVLFDG